LVEHGAGIGTFTRFLLAEDIQRLILIVPAANLLDFLRHGISPWQDKVQIFPTTLEECENSLRSMGTIETIISVNVLEHIVDDRRTLSAMARILRDGGHLIVFVPALPALYGSLDRNFGHMRRYRRGELRSKVLDAGFQIVNERFMNLPGIISWLIAARILRRPVLTASSVEFYDRWIIPVIARLERLCPPPIGQNLLLIAQKPSPSC